MNANPNPRYDFDPYDDLGETLERSLLGRKREAHRAARARPSQRPNREARIASVADQDESLETGFQTRYQPSRHERAWLYEALAGFYLRGEITDVLRMVKGGKEACVYLCASPGLGGGLVAAKVYRPRRFRNLRNDARYRRGRENLDAEGKQLRDDRAQRAIAKGTDRGKQLAHDSWLAHELNAMRLLHAAGVDVPEPFDSGPNVILMGYVGEPEMPAPTLSQVRLPRDEAGPLFERLLFDIERMLECGIVHGDLSAYNVLYHQGSVTLIDFPQVVDPLRNPEARAIFDRDVLRICQYFGAYGIQADAAALAQAIWSRALEEDPWSDPQRLPSELSLLEQQREARELERELGEG